MNALYFPAQNGQMDICELLLSHNADVNRDFPLCGAAGNGHLAVFRLLLEHGADVLAVNEDSKSALTLAVAGNHKDVVALLAPAVDKALAKLSQCTARLEQAAQRFSVNALI